MAYRIVAISMSVSDLQVDVPNAGLLKCDFSYSCAAVDKISTDSTSCGPSVIAVLTNVKNGIWQLKNFAAMKPRYQRAAGRPRFT